MYESYYGLTCKPFQLNPDPTFYFASKQHCRAMAYLEYGLHQNEGFIVVTGEIGAGKTTIVRGLLNQLDSTKVVAAQLVSTQFGAEDTLRMVAAAFGVRTKDLSKSDVLLSLEAFLVDVTRQGKRCLLIVDEAQNLTPNAVEELRMLSNFQIETQALLQSFLIGQPEFRAIMHSPHMQQLRQRVIAACHIGPMDQAETRGYVEHRLKRAGFAGESLFNDEAFEAIYLASGGVPRRINSLCDRVLLSGFLGARKTFSGDDVSEVAKELEDETLAPAAAFTSDPHKRSAAEAPLLDIDLTSLELAASTADQATRLISNLKHDMNEQRSVRLERGVLRIERSCAAILTLLQQLVTSVRVQQAEKETRP